MLDIEHILKDAGAATSSGFGEVDGSPKAVNLGNGLVRGNLVIDILEIDIEDADESYTIHLMGGSDAAFTEEVSLGSKELGANSGLEGSVDTLISRVVVPFQNEERGIIYPYVRVRHVIGGTSPSIDYQARLEKDIPARGYTSLTATTAGTATTTTTTV